MFSSTITVLVALGCSLQVAAQLSGTVGPLTSRAAKAAVNTCNIMDYGGVADASTDNSQAISDAWDACAETGGEVYIPEGDYGLSTWLSLSSSTAMSFRLDGIIYRTGTDGGNMLFFEHMTDFEFYSSTSAGAIQGYGYEFHEDGEYGPRILRFYDVTSFSIHDVALVDAPQFHFTMDTCTDGEVYNMVIHGGNEGGLDGIDVWGTNIWIHDVEVSNKDECVTVKNPSDHLLIENIFCNWSGGCAMGSLATDTDIHDIEYKNVYTQSSNQMYMFKSYGGSGTVSDVTLANFIGHSNAYTLDLDTAWSSMDPVDGDGILYTNISFSGWKGTCADGAERPPVKFNCPAEVPCTEMDVEDFNVWTDEGDVVEWWCENAYGTGVCLDEDDATTTYTTTQTISSVSDYSISTMTDEITAGLGLTVSIPIPTIRTSFFPGVSAYSPLMADSASEATEAVAASSAVEAEVSSVAVSSTPLAQVVSTPVAATPVATTPAAASSAFITVATSAAVVSTTPVPVVTSSPEISIISQVASASTLPTSSSFGWAPWGGFRGSPCRGRTCRNFGGKRI